MSRVAFIPFRGAVVLVLAVALALVLRKFRAGEVSLTRFTPAPAAADVAPAFRAGAAAGKPWVDDFSSFAAEHSGRWVVGHSGRPCLSEAEAIQTARADAANAIAALVHAPRAAAEIRAGALQVDELVERFVRPYGTVWVGSVLADASQEKVEGLVRRYAAEIRGRAARDAAVRMGAIGLAVLAWLAYVPLNALTKGYFAPRLRVAAMAVTTVAIVFLG